MIDFLAFVLWALGGTIVVALCVAILGAVLITLRKQWRDAR